MSAWTREPSVKGDAHGDLFLLFYAYINFSFLFPGLWQKLITTSLSIKFQIFEPCILYVWHRLKFWYIWFLEPSFDCIKSIWNCIIVDIFAMQLACSTSLIVSYDFSKMIFYLFRGYWVIICSRHFMLLMVF